MNATQRLIEAVEEVFRLSQLDYDGIDILVQRAAANQGVKEAIAAAKEEQATGLDVVSDAELELQFRGTNFGGVDPRQVLDECLRSTAKGYAVGSTIRHIAANLGLIELRGHDGERITDKGLRYLTDAKRRPCDRCGQMKN